MIDCWRGSRCGLVPAFGAFGSVTFVCLRFSNETTSILPGAVHPEQGRLARGALTAHDRDVGVPGARVHDQIRDADLLGVGAEKRRDLLIDGVDRLGPGGAAGGLVAQLERIDGGRLRIGREQHAVRPEGQGPDGRHLRTPVRGGHRHTGSHPVARHPGKRHHSQRRQDLRTHPQILLLLPESPARTCQPEPIGRIRPTVRAMLQIRPKLGTATGDIRTSRSQEVPGDPKREICPVKAHSAVELPEVRLGPSGVESEGRVA